jgi:NAD(P)-dependent dehydrogenase (short-subunit alcohol dehydrogenase family)
MEHKHFDFSGKTAVITGGAGVLGKHMAMTLASHGARVAVLSRTLSSVESVAKWIVEAGFKAIGVSADVTDKESLEAAKARVNDAFGPVDILINAAGGNHPKATTTDETFDPMSLDDPLKQTFFSLDPDAIDTLINLNYTGTLLASQVFMKDMVGRQGTTVINVSSMSAYAPLTKIPAYSGAKAAVSNLTQWMAVHFASSGIRVNAIAPGFFSTEQNRTLLWNADGTPTPRSGKILSQTPMGRFGEPEELAGTLLWLADSATSGFVTGIIVPVDGGFSAFSGV